MDGWEQIVALLVSILVPFVTGLLVRKSYAKWVKALVAFVLAAAVALVTTWVTGQWDGLDLAGVLLACYGVGQVTFFLIVDRVPGLKDWLQGLLNRDPK
jgi:hypothetical protein